MDLIRVLSAPGARKVLTTVGEGPAPFKDLEGLVGSTRTLSKRLKELTSAGLLRKGPDGYRATSAGLLALLTLEETSHRIRAVRHGEEYLKISPDYLRPPMRRLARLFLSEFDTSLVSLAVFGSSVSGAFGPGRSDMDVLYIVEDGTGRLWEKEARVFRRFRPSREYTLLDAYMKSLGLGCHPDVSVLALTREMALRFQPVYLDMMDTRAILYDKADFLAGVLERLRVVLGGLGSRRVQYPDGSWAWVLKPDLRLGEDLQITLTSPKA